MAGDTWRNVAHSQTRYSGFLQSWGIVARPITFMAIPCVDSFRGMTESNLFAPRIPTSNSVGATEVCNWRHLERRCGGYKLVGDLVCQKYSARSWKDEIGGGKGKF